MPISLKTLLDAHAVQDIGSILEEVGVSAEHWFPVGGTESNAANIETAKSRVSPIVERIVNGIDAILEKEMLERNELAVEPSSPRLAVERWLGIPGGAWSEYSRSISDSDRTKWASDFCIVTFVDSQIHRNPTIIVRDFGIGQHPQDFQNTLLRLGNSPKIRFKYLCGIYGHGGSSTYRFCPYTIIISRRRLTLLNGKEDKIGWTIVRQNRDRQDLKGTVYEYYAPNGQIPNLEPTSDFEFGTYIAHIQYDARRIGAPLSLEGYRSFRHYLFDPVLPFRLEDVRDKPFRRNMFGARAVLTSEDNVHIRYENRWKIPMSVDGELRIRCWVFKMNTEDPSRLYLENYLDIETSPYTMPVTLNGQRHGAFERSILKEAKLSLLQKYMLVQVEIDGLSRNMKAGLFTSNREGLVEEGEAIARLRSEIIGALKDDPEIQQIEREILEITRQHSVGIVIIKEQFHPILS